MTRFLFNESCLGCCDDSVDTMIFSLSPAHNILVEDEFLKPYEETFIGSHAIYLKPHNPFLLLFSAIVIKPALSVPVEHVIQLAFLEETRCS